MSSIVLRREKRGTFFARHPWVLDKSIQSSDGRMEDGQVVDLVLPDGKFIARGIFNSRSRIRLRLYSWDPDESLDDDFWRRRLQRAVRLRQDLQLLHPERATRLVFSEADGISGVIVDYYAGFLVVQVTSLAMQRRLDTLIPCLTDLVQPHAVLVRLDERVAKAEGLEAANYFFQGEAPAGPILIQENGLTYEVDITEGQKTGYYLDQRDNRRRAADFCRGRRVLDVCCYGGGFALNCAKYGAPVEVIGVDSSQRAVEMAARHAQLNGLPNLRFQVGECFETLERLAASRETFGTIILDPPRFSANRRTVSQALHAYHRLNRLAMQCLDPGGYLVTCSCSGTVIREDFVAAVMGAGQKARRDVQLIDHRGAAADHPVLLSCPETEYLKCLFCCVG